MRRAIFIIAGAIAVASGITHAQEHLVGDWSGSYLIKIPKEFNVGVELKVTSVEGNAVTGSAKTSGGACGGEYQMRGKLDGNNLGMISTNSTGRAGDCKFGFRATIEGNTIKGQVGSFDMNLTRK